MTFDHIKIKQLINGLKAREDELTEDLVGYFKREMSARSNYGKAAPVEADLDSVVDFLA